MLSMPPAAATPALLQTTWTLPNASIVSFAARSTLAASATSQTTPRTSGPTLCRLLTAAESASVSISASITFMPASAKARPSANPMPSAPPVTNAVLPASSRMIFPYGLKNAVAPTFCAGTCFVARAPRNDGVSGGTQSGSNGLQNMAERLLANFELEKAIALRWALRDIVAERTRLTPPKDDELQTLLDLGLVEMRDDHPVVTEAGLAALE